MKKVIRLLCAILLCIMATTLMATEAQASSTNRLVGIPEAMIPSYSLFVESDFGGFQLPSNVGSVDPTAPGNRGVVPYAIQASYLELELRSTINAGSTFRLDLENAEWMFNSVISMHPADTTVGMFVEAEGFLSVLPAGRANLVSSGDNINTWNIPAWRPPIGVSDGDLGLHRIGLLGVHSTVNLSMPGFPIASTYDLELGVFIPRTPGNHGTYIRAFDGMVGTPSASAVAGLEVPYLLDVSLTNQRIATITLLQTGHLDNVIRIPLVIRATANDDVRINVVTQGHTELVTPSPHHITTAAVGSTIAHVVNPVTARDKFEIERLVIREVRANSIRRTGVRAGYNATSNAFDLVLSPGFYFANNLQDVRVGFEYGLQWRERMQLFPNGDILIWEQGPGFGNALDRASTVGAEPSSSAISDFDVFFPGNNRSILRVRLQHFIESQALAGILFIDGLVVWADEDAPFDVDIEVSLRNTDEIAAIGSQGAMFRNNVNMVTPQTIRVGTRLDEKSGEFALTINNDPPLAEGVTVSGQSRAGNFDEGATVSVNAGTRMGYVFLNWTVYEDESGTIDLNGAGAVTSFTMPDNPVTLVANWEAVEGYTVTFRCLLDGEHYQGCNNDSIHIVPRYNSISVQERPIFVRAGYTFAGWDIYLKNEPNKVELEYKEDPEYKGELLFEKLYQNGYELQYGYGYDPIVATEYFGEYAPFSDIELTVVSNNMFVPASEDLLGSITGDKWATARWSRNQVHHPQFHDTRPRPAFDPGTTYRPPPLTAEQMARLKVRQEVAQDPSRVNTLVRNQLNDNATEVGLTLASDVTSVRISRATLNRLIDNDTGLRFDRRIISVILPVEVMKEMLATRAKVFAVYIGEEIGGGDLYVTADIKITASGRAISIFEDTPYTIRAYLRGFTLPAIGAGNVSAIIGGENLGGVTVDSIFTVNAYKTGVYEIRNVHN